MGDGRRFQVFAAHIARNLPQNSSGVSNSDISIADVAGGKGYMRLALAEIGIKNVETWDKRHNHVPGKQKYGYFDYKTAPQYNYAIGMHPDEGTDQIIHYCGKWRVRGFICPCCVKYSARVYWGRNKYKDWKIHLEKLANEFNLNVKWDRMNFNGKNDLMIVSPD